VTKQTPVRVPMSAASTGSAQGTSGDSPGASDAGSNGMVVKIVPEGVIRGRLSVSNGDLPMGLPLMLWRKQIQDGVAVWSGSGSVATNSHGDFRFAGLAPGDYKIMTREWTDQGSGGAEECFGYAPAFDADAADLASAPPIHVSVGETVEANLNLRGATFYRVRIPVTVPKEGGTSVTVGEEDGSSGYSLGFNAQKQSVEGYLPNGAYDVRVQSFGQPQASTGRARVEVAGRPVQTAALALVPNGTIPVRVHNEYTPQPDADSVFVLNPSLISANGGRTQINQPVQQQLRLQGRSIEVSLRTFGRAGASAGLNAPGSGDDGLMLQNVSEGIYAVEATPHRGYVASLTSNGVDLLREPLVVGAGGAAQPIEVTVRDDGASLAGSIAGAPATANAADFVGEGIFLTCIPTQNLFGRVVAGMVGMNGRFSFANMAPGRYLVLASRSPMLEVEYRTDSVVREYEAKGTVVTLSAGEKVEIQVSLLPEEGN